MRRAYANLTQELKRDASSFSETESAFLDISTCSNRKAPDGSDKSDILRDGLSLQAAEM